MCSLLLACLRKCISESSRADGGLRLGLKGPAPASIWEYLWPRGLLILVAAIWGTNFATVKFIGDADSLDVSAGAFVRFGIAALAMAPFTWKAIQRLRTEGMHDATSTAGVTAAAPTNANGLKATPSAAMVPQRRRNLEYAIGVLGLGTVVFAGYYTQAIGLLGTDANKSAFLCSLTVVLVPFMERMLFGKSIQSRAWLSALLATVGVGLLELDESTVTTASDLWSFMQAVFFGGGFMIVEHLTRRFPGRPLEIAALNLTIVSLYSGLWCLLSAISSGTGIQDVLMSLAQILIDHSTGVAGALLYTGLVTTALAVMMQTTAISKVSAEEAAVIFCLEPLFAVAFSAALLGESISLKGAFGGALILFAVLSNQALNPEMRARLRSPLAVTDGVPETPPESVLLESSELTVQNMTGKDGFERNCDQPHDGQLALTKMSTRRPAEKPTNGRHPIGVKIAMNEMAATTTAETPDSLGNQLDLQTNEPIITDAEEMAGVRG
ncbi:hypothetical protein F1559_003419 [Cyanidiococcus yangmingshanensis]|uniref:EamA domain-containing protein n=1 Tax=Cyanidiococcus yangmingshanensis TaxID=2690220 RepID=A0A7J7INB3_9RHOD|nr:hypothetical protein F1559_003419 [Cyanidiococcus yangmingshanensis]